MIIELVTIVIGIAIVLILADIITRNAIGLAERFQLSGSFIGLTILSIGTSIPEIITHIIGSAKILQHPETINSVSGLVVGANIGAGIFQQNLLFIY